MEKRNLFEAATMDAISARLDRLTPESEPQWGKMNVAQMLAHSAEVLEVSGGKPLENTPWFIRLLGGFIRKSVMANKPYQRSLRTHPQYVVADPQDFEVQMARLVSELKRMHQQAKKGSGESVHPLFGKMSAEDTGWVQYKHLDHHLTQFGV